MSFSSEEQKAFNAIFASLDKEQLGVVTGEASRTTFEKSQLPPSVLGEIWQLADPTNLGFLNQYSFFVALRLIGHAQRGKTPDKSLINVPGPLPKFLDSTLPSSDNSVASPSNQQRQATVNPPLQPQFTSLPPLTNADISKFSQLFAKSAVNSTIGGDQARQIFTKAKLPTSTLGEIWSLVDIQNKGFLNRDEFIAAMFLIQGTISGSIKTLPQSIPNGIWGQLKQSSVPPPPLQPQSSFNTAVNSIQPSATGSRVPSTFNNASSDWVISPEKKEQFDSIFEGLDKESKGVLSPNEVATFLMTSKLPQDVLANIWDLSDIYNHGQFGKDEFAIAMFLVQKKIAGVELPNIIPESLVPNHNQPAAVAAAPPQQQPNLTPQIPSRATQPNKSSFNDLLDLNDAFTTPSPSASEPPRSAAATNSPFVPATISPVATNTTGSFQPKPFVPTSSFGQSIAKQNTADQQIKSSVAPVPQLQPQPQAPAPVPAPVIVPVPVQIAQQQSPVQTTGVPPPVAPRSFSSQSFQPIGSTGFNPALNRISNDDLLTDSNPEISGKLSQATSDMANLSNQIGSLTTQTAQLHDKRSRAERELAKMTTLKNDIEGKLTKLRNAYSQEVQQTEQVEQLLQSSKVETEELRKETSIAEARYNEVQSNLQGLQGELEESQKENASLKERLGTLNAEHIELSKELEKIQGDVKQSKGLVAINSEQLKSTELKSSGIREEIEKLLASSKELDGHHEAYVQKQVQFESTRSSVEQLEKELAERQQTHQQNEAQFQQKEQELEQRLAQQKQYEDSVQQQEQRLNELWTDFQQRQQQFQQAEEQLQHQQIEYAERIQAFSNRQIEDATKGYGAAAAEEETPVKASELQSKSVAHSEPAKATFKEVTEGSGATLVSGLIGAGVGLVAGSIGSAAVAATSATESGPADIEKNTDFSTKETNTDNSTTVDSAPTEDNGFQAGQFQQFNHLDIPRPESTTSSVVNNAPQSVRGDDVDIDENDTITEDEEVPASAADVLSKDYNKVEAENKKILESSKLEHSFDNTNSPGSFEMIDAAKPEIEIDVPETAVPEASEIITNEQADVAESSIPGAWDITPVHDKLAQNSASQDGEFPPIKELDIDESDSDDEQTGANVEGVFDFEQAAKAPVPAPAAIPSKDTQPSFDEFDTSNEPKAATAAAADEFDEFDEFDGLTAAKQEIDEDDEFTNATQDIEDTSFYGAEPESQVPPVQLTQQQGTTQPPANGEDNDEWEQIFAGFGNQPQADNAAAQSLAHPQPQTVQQAVTSGASAARSKIATTPRSIAVQELTGMGFTEEEALAALKREKWNLEAATNYLLDNA